MDELLMHLQKLGFSEEYLQIIKEQKIANVDSLNIEKIDYVVYGQQVKYSTDIQYSDIQL